MFPLFITKHSVDGSTPLWATQRRVFMFWEVRHSMYTVCTYVCIQMCPLCPAVTEQVWRTHSACRTRGIRHEYGHVFVHVKEAGQNEKTRKGCDIIQTAQNRHENMISCSSCGPSVSEQVDLRYSCTFSFDSLLTGSDEVN